MNTLHTRMRQMGALLSGVLVLVACGPAKDPPPALGPGKVQDKATFDPALMEARIRELYEGNVVGFSYAINHKGALERAGGWGDAQRVAAGGAARPMTENTRIHLASVSKTVNAIFFLTMLHKLQDFPMYKYLSLDSPVSPWLPEDWVQGKGFAGQDGVTFRQILMHESGLKQMFDAMSEADRANWGNDWDGLEFVVANGAMPGSPRAYKNANAALFRILIPEIYEPLLLLTEVGKDDVGPMYVSMLNTWVLDNIGIEERVDCRFRRGEDYAMYYDFDGPSDAGYIFDRADESCGGHAGLQMSALEVAQLLAYARHSDVLLGEAEKEALHQDALGFYERETTGDMSTARLMKRGDWYHYYEGKDTNPQASAEIHTCVLAFPYEVEAVLLVNSSLAPGTPSPCAGLKDAYEKALVTP